MPEFKAGTQRLRGEVDAMGQWSLGADQRAFWWLVREGEGVRESAQLLGYDAHAGLSWARRTGGVRPELACHIPAGRYLYLEERIEILVGVRLGLSIRQIAAGLGRAPSTVLRELRRQRGPQYRTGALIRRSTGPRGRGRPRTRRCDYQPRKAQRDAERAASAAATRPGSWPADRGCGTGSKRCWKRSTHPSRSRPR